MSDLVDKRPAIDCRRCGKQVPYDQPEGEGLDNALRFSGTVAFDGGYAEFIDAWDGPVEVTLVETIFCHDCAHLLCEFFGIDPQGWHSHRLNTPEDAQHYLDKHEAWHSTFPDSIAEAKKLIAKHRPRKAGDGRSHLRIGETQAEYEIRVAKEAS